MLRCAGGVKPHASPDDETGAISDERGGRVNIRYRLIALTFTDATDANASRSALSSGRASTPTP